MAGPLRDSPLESCIIIILHIFFNEREHTVEDLAITVIHLHSYLVLKTWIPLSTHCVQKSPWIGLRRMGFNFDSVTSRDVILDKAHDHPESECPYCEVKLELTSSEGGRWWELSEMLYTEVLGAVQFDVSGGRGCGCYTVKHRKWPPLENLVFHELEGGRDLVKTISREVFFKTTGLHSSMGHKINLIRWKQNSVCNREKRI